MEDIFKMISEKKEKLKEEIEEKRSLVSRLQKEISDKEKELSALSQTEQSLGLSIKKEQPEKLVIQSSSEKYDEEERAKRYYVIYNGPGKGIYDEWGKASLFITGVKGIRHKKFLSKKEAQDSFNEENKEAAKTAEVSKAYLEKLQSPKPQTSRMVNLGKIPSPRTIDHILTKADLQEKARLTKKIYDDDYMFLKKYSDDDKQTSIYPVDSKSLGAKAVVLPEADNIKTYMLYQCGFIHAIYFKSLDIFRYFPENMKRAIQVYAQRMLKAEKGMREGFLRIYSTNPEFDESGEVVQPAIQLCQIGGSNSNYPVMGVIEDVDELEAFLHNYTYILQKGISVQGRINYSAKSTIIWSQQARKPSEQDIQILTEFLLRTVKNEFNFSAEVKQEICLRLQRDFSEDHVCQLCEQSSGDLEPIKEE
ncbi:putative transactivation protein [Peanut chlorotic streak virus]|uniref:Transactivator/viroplasmin protein n=1 Tax=Peanut chlorotic streak virus TaxID=35593 RepID=Q84683_9VIRU|nr:hypothetical protein [Peanut chlorotic streak virus]AAA50241.1 putative transactivation protein [Peanut chlorotic streak virus]